MADSTNELLGEQLGKGKVTVLEGTDAIATATDVSYYAVHFPLETQVTNFWSITYIVD